MRQIEIYDLETLSNLFTYTGYNCNTKTWYQFVISSWRNDFEELINHLKTDIVQVGFNNENFDYPIVHHLLNHQEEYHYKTGQEIAQKLYDKSQELISNQFNTIADKNKYIQQIDLFKIWHYDNKARKTSLKDLEFAMQMENVEEMPIHHTTWCKRGDEELVLEYNKNDVEATYKFFLTTLGRTDYPLYKGKNKLELRENLQKKFGINCINLPDVRMGEQLMLNLYSKAVKKNPFDIKKLRTERTEIKLKDCIPSWCSMRSNIFKSFLDTIEETTIPIPVPKDSFEYSVIYNGYKWYFGLGGSHGCCEPGIYNSDDEFVIIDYDVGSLYPSVAKSLKLYPEHLGPEFMELYEKFINDRLTEKHKPKDQQDKVLIEGYKLILNGEFIILNTEII